MDNEKLMRELIIGRLRARFTGQYKEITHNAEGNPDLVLANHGLTLAVVQVETEAGITPEKCDKWKELVQSSGSKLILIVPKNSKAKAIDLLWKSGIADRVSVGSYEISIQMP